MKNNIVKSLCAVCGKPRYIRILHCHSCKKSICKDCCIFDSFLDKLVCRYCVVSHNPDWRE